MSNLYNERLNKRYKYIVGILIVIMITCVYFIFFSEGNASESEAKDIISKIDKGYDIIVTSDNYVVGDNTYYTVHANIKDNESYSNIFSVGEKNCYRVNTSYYNVENQDIWYARYCVDKESKVVYIEFRDNSKRLIRYSDYNENINYALDIIKKKIGSNIPNVDVTVEGDIYTIHIYEVVKNEDESHTATIGWYDFNVKNKEVKDVMSEEVLN
ncbi:hypothetical protein [Romboutsia sp. 1001713B170207_170306_H8]|uniref:hypothetical protein n=1 Tax=Romboutsia sp. 1001713B170207_170306_H8 TaxID=2787112 RepID=UPI001899D154|nr:hypothetical protein [Romboutsia sp. 1001713B170207_170306_H8]